MKQKTTQKTVRAWIVLDKKSKPIYNLDVCFACKHPRIHVAKKKPTVRLNGANLPVVPCTITFTVPKKK